jgi:hypothetical protein
MVFTLQIGDHFFLNHPIGEKGRGDNSRSVFARFLPSQQESTPGHDFSGDGYVRYTVSYTVPPYPSVYQLIQPDYGFYNQILAFSFASISGILFVMNSL